MACSATIVDLVERKRHWQLLQFLAGQSEAALSAQHRTELEALTSRYSEAVDAREVSLDTIAQAMADLATSSGAPVGGPLQRVWASPVPPLPRSRLRWPPRSRSGRSGWTRPTFPAATFATCYQELPQLFERC